MKETESKDMKLNSSFSFVLRLILAVTLLSGAIYTGYLWYLSYSGYCFKEGRYLADDELIQAALRASHFRINIDATDESLRTFHLTHPGCCIVTRTGPMASSWIDAAFGFYYVEVQLNYEVKPKWVQESVTGTYRFYSEYVRVSACGKTGRTYGQHTKTLQSAATQSDHTKGQRRFPFFIHEAHAVMSPPSDRVSNLPLYLTKFQR